MNTLFLVAGVLCAIVWGIHTFGGGRTVAIPLRVATGLSDTPKFTQLYCWHLVTIVLAVMAFGLIYAAFVPSAEDLAGLIVVLAMAFCALGLAMPRAFGQTFKEMPQGFLFLPIGLLGLAGLMV